MQNQESGLSEINLTSLVDVCLTLVIVFMASSPFMIESAINVSAPAQEQGAKAADLIRDRTVIHIRSDNKLLVNGRSRQFPQLPQALRAELADKPKQDILLSADDEVSHEQVIAVIDQVKQVGIKKLFIVKSHRNAAGSERRGLSL